MLVVGPHLFEVIGDACRSGPFVEKSEEDGSRSGIERFHEGKIILEMPSYSFSLATLLW